MQRRQGKLRTKGNAPEVEAVQQNPGLGNGGAPAQDPGDEFKGSDVVPTWLLLPVHGVAGEVEPRHAEPGLIGGLVIQRVVSQYIGHADHGIVPVQSPHLPEPEGVAPGRDGDGFLIDIIEIQVPAKIVVLRLIGDGSTHKNLLNECSRLPGRSVTSIYYPSLLHMNASGQWHLLGNSP